MSLLSELLASRAFAQDAVLRVLPRSTRWVVAGLVVGLAGGAAVVALTPAQTRATQVVELSEVTTTLDLGGGSTGAAKRVTVDTDAQILRSDAVVATVAERMGADREQVRSAISVTARPLTRVLEITYTAQDTESAIKGAVAASDALLEARQSLVLDRVEEYLAQVQASTDDPTKYTFAEGSGDPGRILSVLESRRRRALVAGVNLPDPGRVLTPARVTAQGDRGDIEMPIGSGGAVGALLGFLVALVRARAGQGTRPVTSRGVGPREPSGEVLAGSAWGPPVPRRTRRAGPRLRDVALWTILLTLLGTVIGATAAYSIPRVAVAQASYLVTPLRGNAFSTTTGNTLVSVRTEAQLVTSEAVLEAVARDAPFTLTQLRRRTSAGQVGDTRVVVITFRGRTQAEAAQMAVRIAGAALDERAARAERARQREIADLTAQNAATEEQIKDLVAKAGSPRQVRVLTQRSNSVDQQIKALEADVPNPGAVVSTADREADANRQVRLGAIVGGAAVGFLLGLLYPRRRLRARRRARMRRLMAQNTAARPDRARPDRPVRPPARSRT